MQLYARYVYKPGAHADAEGKIISIFIFKYTRKNHWKNVIYFLGSVRSTVVWTGLHHVCVCMCMYARSGEKMYVRVCELCVNIYRARRKEKKRKQERKQISIIRYELVVFLREKKTWNFCNNNNRTKDRREVKHTKFKRSPSKLFSGSEGRLGARSANSPLVTHISVPRTVAEHCRNYGGSASKQACKICRNHHVSNQARTSPGCECTFSHIQLK